MRRTRKILIWIFAVIMVSLVILFIAASIYINSFKPNLENILTENIGLETRIDGDISLKITPGISFIAKDLKVISSETYVLKIEQAEISVDYLGIFKSSIDVRALRLYQPQVYIVRDVNGKFNYKTDRIEPTSGDIDPDIHDFNLSILRIQNGRLLYIDQQYGDTLLVDGINLKSDQIGITGSLSNIEVDKIMFNGTVELDRIKLNMLKAEDLKFKIDGRGGKMAILPLDNTYFGGKITGKAILDFTKVPTQLHIQHQVAGFDLGNFSDAMQSDDVFKGKLNYQLDVTFSSFNWLQAKQSLNGTVLIDGENLNMKGIDLDKVIQRFNKSQQFNVIDLGAIFVAGPYGAVFTKGISFAELLSQNMGDSTQIIKLVSNWNIINGVANAQDVAFNTNHYRIAMTGSLDFRKNNYNDVTIALINVQGCEAIGEHINGSFNDPETKSISAIGAIAGPIDNLWKDLTKPLRKPCTPIYTGSVEHPIH